jgi:HEAT repeat protein
VLLGLVTDAGSHQEMYVRSLSDPDPRIRALALRELAEFRKEDLPKLKEIIEGMLSDPEMGVKRAAMEVLKKL